MVPDRVIEDRWKRGVKWFIWAALQDRGLSIREIAHIDGVAPSTVSRGVSKARSMEFADTAFWLFGMGHVGAIRYVENKLRPLKPLRKRYDLCQST